MDNDGELVLPSLPENLESLHKEEKKSEERREVLRPGSIAAALVVTPLLTEVSPILANTQATIRMATTNMQKAGAII
jgi:hypothetical protein